LGAYIIKNTNYEGGITRILDDYGFDIGMLSRLIKGTSPNPIANQLMHSDLDADRMDYLIRDSHYTGIKYGQFDRDYILANLETYHAGRGQTGFGVRENAVHAVEDFLIARYGWYSQVIKNPASAKFDIISSHLAEAFLERGLLHSFSDLLEMIDGQSEKFYWWNDVYFITRCQEIHSKRTVADPRVSEMNEMLLFRRPPRTLQNDIFSHRILKAEGAQGGEAERKRLEGKIASFVSDAEAAFQKFGTGKEWLVVDVPAKDVVFTSGLRQRGRDSGLLERDPIKVVRRNGSATLLLDYENSLMRMLSNFTNFAPNVYANDAAVMLLKKRHLI
jgi:HD superfamily phosphohydrolase